MKVTCDSCGSSYAIADEKVAGRTVKVRCRSCGNTIVVESGARGTGDRPSTAAAGSWSVNLSENDSRVMTTAELVDAYRRGELADAYVWQEGMADWQPPLEVPELAAAIQSGSAALGSKPRNSDVGRAPAARVAQPRAVNADLFSDVERAGSEDEGPGGPKFTGTRNESSVLFSLDALKAGVSTSTATTTAKAAPSNRPAPRAPTKGASPAKADAFDDLMNLGGSGGGIFNLGSNQALLNAPPPPPEPVKPKSEPPKPALAAAAIPSAAPAYNTPGAKSGSKLPLIVGGVLGVLALGAAAAFLLVKPTEAPSAAPSVETAAAAPTPPPKPVPTEPKQAEPPKAEEPAPVAAAPSASAAPAAPAETAAAPTKPAEAGRPATGRPAGDKKDPPKKEEPAPAPAGGGAGFDKGAAVAALNTAASAASSCKRPGGPTGPGRVSVTFAPSGRATNATVSGGSYGGTPVGGCIASVFRSARVPAFSGDPVTVSKSFNISP
jgi:predicted Zn finger-like uncharacterized protein